jgi:hypothetical protein
MDEECDEELEQQNNLIQPQVQYYCSSSDEYEHDDDDDDDDDAEEPKLAFRARIARDALKVIDFTGRPNGLNRSAAPNINNMFSPFSIFILFFQQVFQIVLDKTNHFFHKYKAARNRPGPSTQPCDITIEELFLFFVIIIQMGCDHCNSLKR